MQITFSANAVNNNDNVLKNVSEIADELSEISEFRAIAISKDGELILEKYYNNETSEPHNNLHIMSVTKSITSLLVGIAIDYGFIQNIDQRLSELINGEVFEMNEKFANLTLKQLMTMQAGFEWNCFDPLEYKSWITYPDQLEYIFNKSFLENPGENFQYNEGAAHLLSVVLSETTGLKMLDFANEFLFSPLEIGKRRWNVDNRGYNMGGIGLILTVKDMLKIGGLILNDGFYNGQQIISKEWIIESTTAHANAPGYIPYSAKYGYYWWTGKILDQSYILAMGYGGQFIFIFKELNLVIATLSSYLNNSNIIFNNSDQIFTSIIMNIVNDQTNST